METATLVYVGRKYPHLFGCSALCRRAWDMTKLAAQFDDRIVDGEHNPLAYGWALFDKSAFIEPEDGHA